MLILELLRFIILLLVIVVDILTRFANAVGNLGITDSSDTRVPYMKLQYYDLCTEYLYIKRKQYLLLIPEI